MTALDQFVLGQAPGIQAIILLMREPWLPDYLRVLKGIREKGVRFAYTQYARRVLRVMASAEKETAEAVTRDGKMLDIASTRHAKTTKKKDRTRRETSQIQIQGS